MPEDTEPTAAPVAAQKGVIGMVDADELVVLGDDLLGVLVVPDKVLDVVQQPVLGQRPERKPSALVPAAAICSRLILSFSSSGRSQRSISTNSPRTVCPNGGDAGTLERERPHGHMGMH